MPSEPNLPGRVLADPGGRTADGHGLKSRFREWSRPPEPRCRKQDIGAVSFARRPDVSLIWRGHNQVMQSGSDLGYRNSYWEYFSCTAEALPLDPVERKSREKTRQPKAFPARDHPVCCRA